MSNNEFNEKAIKVLKNTATTILSNPYLSFYLGYLGYKFVRGIYSKFANRIRYDTVLEIELDRLHLEESPCEDFNFPGFSNPVKRVYFRDIVEAVEKAAVDPRVKTILIKGSVQKQTQEHIYELREAILEFLGKTSAGQVTKDKTPLTMAHPDRPLDDKIYHHRQVVYYAEDWGEAGQSLINYYLASAASKIFVNVNGILFLQGLFLNQPFLKNMLAKLDTKVEVYQREKYKNALTSLVNEKYNKEHGEQYQELVSGTSEYIVRQIAASKNVSIDTVNEWCSKGAFTAEDAVKQKLVDAVMTRREVYEYIAHCHKCENPENLKLIYARTYRKQAGNKYPAPWFKHLTPTIGIVHLEGAVLSGINDGKNIYANKAISLIRGAAANKQLSAIVIRINSPGGSACASHAILEEIILAKKKKKIVVSMGPLCASGGYYIACQAHKIVASPLSIVGSIGVIMGKFNFRGSWDKVGVTFDTVKSHKESTAFSLVHDTTEYQRKNLNLFLDDIYNNFKDVVRKSRKFTNEQVAELAQGKIYLGEKAKEVNLIDAVGGVSTAIEVARSLIKCEKKVIRVVPYPPKLTPWQVWNKLLFSDKPRNSRDEEKNSLISARTRTTNTVTEVLLNTVGLSSSNAASVLFDHVVGLFNDQEIKQQSKGLVQRFKACNSTIQMQGDPTGALTSFAN